MSFLSIRDLCHSYGKKPVLNCLSLEVDEGEFISLLGPSGCGKTTILNLIAGFELPDSGVIEINGEILNDLPPHKRNMGMVFQNYALFPHMTLIDNVAYGLRQRNISKKSAYAAAGEALELVQLQGMADRRPKQLSGGQQQRVALARAIVIKPKLLLLDESLSALDRKLRIEMQVELRKIQKTVGITTLFVTHDQEEALTLSDRVALLREGRVIQFDAPTVIYERPKDQFVASFLGQSNFLEGRIVSRKDKQYVLEMENGQKIAFGCTTHLPKGSSCTIAIRPEKMTISQEQSPQTPVQGTISLVTYAGGTTQYRVQALGKDWIIQSQNTLVGGDLLTLGDAVWFGWNEDNSLVLDISSN